LEIDLHFSLLRDLLGFQANQQRWDGVASPACIFCQFAAWAWATRHQSDILSTHTLKTSDAEAAKDAPLFSIL
jgi:hypothetical protein